MVSWNESSSSERTPARVESMEVFHDSVSSERRSTANCPEIRNVTTSSTQYPYPSCSGVGIAGRCSPPPPQDGLYESVSEEEIDSETLREVRRIELEHGVAGDVGVTQVNLSAVPSGSCGQNRRSTQQISNGADISISRLVQGDKDPVDHESFPRLGGHVGNENRAEGPRMGGAQTSLGGLLQSGSRNWSQIVRQGPAPLGPRMSLKYFPPSPGVTRVNPPLEVLNKGKEIWQASLVGFFLDKFIPVQVVEPAA